ncbi:MAG TPA: caspase family protein [Chloroflexaceae bacterium]|nr:caspase family protein [Chloroflexaceae bacterium]
MLQGFPQGHALVIGVGAYADERWNVPTAARDAQGLAQVLGDPATAGYSLRNLELLRDREATRSGVMRALRRLADRAAPDSVVLISFSCHGAQGTDGLYYLATSDARFAEDERIVADTGVSVAELARALRQIGARHLLLLVNACYAGQVGSRLGPVGFGPEGASPGRGRMLPDEAGNELVASGEGRAIITAGRPEQRSYFLSDRDYSFFGQALIDAASGAGIGGYSGYVGLFELYESVHRQVTGAVRREVGEMQEPVLTLLQGVGTFPVASYRGVTGKAELLSARPPAGAAVREVPPINLSYTDKRSVISFEGATIMGDNRIGNVVQGDLTVIGGSYVQQPEEEPDDPLRRLPLLRARVEVARNVDEDERDDAALKLRQAERALTNGDPKRARERVAEAREILREMNNGYINSVVRKLEKVLVELDKALKDRD